MCPSRRRKKKERKEKTEWGGDFGHCLTNVHHIRRRSFAIDTTSLRRSSTNSNPSASRSVVPSLGRGVRFVHLRTMCSVSASYALRSLARRPLSYCSPAAIVLYRIAVMRRQLLTLCSAIESHCASRSVELCSAQLRENFVLQGF